MTDTTAARKELLRRRRAQRTGGHVPAERAAAPAAPADPGDPHALGVAERRMWRIHRLDPDSVSHNITLLLTVDGLPAEQIVAGIEGVLAGTLVLGSVIVDDDAHTPRRRPCTAAGHWVAGGRFWALGRGPLPDETVAADPEESATALARTPFDLTVEVPLRARVFRPESGSDRVTVVLSFHHLAVDDTSWPLLLGAILAGRIPEASDDNGATPTAAADDPLRVELAVAQARKTWAAPDVRYPLSGRQPVTSAEQSWLNPLDEGLGRQLRADLDAADLAAFQAFAPEVGGTGNAALVALVALTATVVTGADDHVMLVPADNRRPGQAPARVGYCGNIVPIRFAFDRSGTVGAALRAGIAAIYSAMEFADVDFGPILTALRGSGGRFPVTELLGSVRNAPLREVPIPDGATVTCRSISPGIASYPLALAVEVAGDGAHVEADCHLATGEAIADGAVSIISALLQRIPSAVDRPLAELIDDVRTTPAGVR